MYYFSIRNGSFNSSHSRPPVPPVILQNNGQPTPELVASAALQGDGFYEVLMDGTLGPKLAQMPAPTYSPREIKIQQAYIYLRGYARDFILGAQTPTNTQRNNALDALVAIQLLEAASE